MVVVIPWQQIRVGPNSYDLVPIGKRDFLLFALGNQLGVHIFNELHLLAIGQRHFPGGKILRQLVLDGGSNRGPQLR